MKKNLLNKLSLLLVVMLVAAMAFGCGKKTEETVNTETESQQDTQSEAPEESEAPVDVVEDTTEAAQPVTSDVTVLGSEEASFVFDLYVTDADEVTTYYEVHTDDATVGEALFNLGVIDDATFFSTVNGVFADWDADEAYWAVYQDGEYAMVGVGEMTLSADTALEIGIVYTIGF